MRYGDPLFEVLMETAAARRGILPIRPDSVVHDYRRDIANMSSAEGRAARRKFRKAWRTIAKRSSALSKSYGGWSTYAVRTLGLGNPQPGQKHCRNRKLAVLQLMRSEVQRAAEVLMHTA